MPAQPFDEVRAQVEKVVKKTFPNAKPTSEWGMDGWSIARPKGAPRPMEGGTMPHDRVFIFLAKRAAGVTLHVWYPGEAYFLEARKKELTGAGFKVMRGCLQFTRKQEYPIGAVAELLADIKEHDGR